MSAIYRRELKSHFISMIAPAFIAYILFWFGTYTVMINFSYGFSQFEYTVANVSFIALLAIPILSMKSFAEDRRSGTEKLLYYLPVKTSSIVAAKYLSALTVFAIPCAVAAFYPLILARYGTVYLNTALSSLLAFFLVGAALLAIGIFISSLTENYMLAAMLGIASIFLIFFIVDLVSLLPGSAAFSFILLLIFALIIALIAYFLTSSIPVAAGTFGVLAAAVTVFYIVAKGSFAGLALRLFSFLALFERMDNFFYGKLDVEAIVYFVSVTVFFLFLTGQAVEKKRWN